MALEDRFNFPKDLSIEPSKPPPPSQSQLISDGAEIEQPIEQYGIAGRIWESAYVLVPYLRPLSSTATIEFDPPCSLFQRSPTGCTILELGSGTGYVGLNLAPHLSKDDILIMTDLEDVCPLLNKNLEKFMEMETETNAPAIYVRPLHWGSKEHVDELQRFLEKVDSGGKKITHIVCSDLVYFPHLLAPLLQSLLLMTSDTINPPIEIIISYKIRSLTKETPFWSAFGAWFTFTPVLSRSPSSPGDSWKRYGSAGGDESFVFVAQRKRESLGLNIPEGDDELMSGVGDDTFESLLFMGIEES